jgi:hypothetical protein
MKKLGLIIISWVISLLVGWSPTTEAAPYKKADVYRAEKELKKLGYDPGRVDGVWSKKTKSAIESFQTDHGLAVNGELDEATRELLGIQKKSAGMQKAPIAKTKRRVTKVELRTSRIELRTQADAWKSILTSLSGKEEQDMKLLETFFEPASVSAGKAKEFYAWYLNNRFKGLSSVNVETVSVGRDGRTGTVRYQFITRPSEGTQQIFSDVTEWEKIEKTWYIKPKELDMMAQSVPPSPPSESTQTREEPKLSESSPMQKEESKPEEPVPPPPVMEDTQKKHEESAPSQVPDRRFSRNFGINGNAGALFPSGDFSDIVDTSFVFGGRALYGFSNRFIVEGNVSYSPLSEGEAIRFLNSVFGLDNDSSILEVTGGARFLLINQGSIIPYVSGALGVYISSGNDETQTDFGGNFGGGLMYFLSRKFALDGQGRYHIISDADVEFFSLTGGVSYFFK